MNDDRNERMKEVEAIIDNMCLMDDDLMSRVFDENIEATQILIKTILQEEVDVIFITENDYFKMDESVYRISRAFETGKMFGDGSHIIYVNGQYRGNDDLGRLMADLNNRITEGFNYKELENGVRHFKVDEEGRKTMSGAVEKYSDKNKSEGRLEGRLEDIKALMKNLKCSAEQAMEKLNVPKE